MPKTAAWKLKIEDDLHPELEPITFADGSPASLNALSRLIPDGIYTTFRTYEGDKILPLDDHIRRLEESASLIGYPLSIPAGPVYRSLRTALQAFQSKETRIRLTVDLEQVPGELYITLEPLHTPTEDDFQHGVKTVTCKIHREVPRAKRTNFIQVAESIRRQLPEQTNEGLLTDESGHILEGLSSNFFAVIAGEIWTAGEGILAGITRATVIALARREGIPLRFQCVSVDALDRLEEAFLTSSSRSVLPVRQIDQTPIGTACPGPITRTLMCVYWQEIQRQLVKI